MSPPLNMGDTLKIKVPWYTLFFVSLCATLEPSFILNFLANCLAVYHSITSVLLFMFAALIFNNRKRLQAELKTSLPTLLKGFFRASIVSGLSSAIALMSNCTYLSVILFLQASMFCIIFTNLAPSRKLSGNG